MSGHYEWWRVPLDPLELLRFVAADFAPMNSMSEQAGLSDFAREWSESLRLKQKAPLGEDEIARMAHDQNTP